jgi:hypothetical protein
VVVERRRGRPDSESPSLAAFALEAVERDLAARDAPPEEPEPCFELEEPEELRLEEEELLRRFGGGVEVASRDFSASASERDRERERERPRESSSRDWRRSWVSQ